MLFNEANGFDHNRLTVPLETKSSMANHNSLCAMVLTSKVLTERLNHHGLHTTASNSMFTKQEEVYAVSAV